MSAGRTGEDPYAGVRPDPGADPVHNRGGCPGGFTAVSNPSTDTAEEGPDALVCASCGALVVLEKTRDGDGGDG